jgi:hypothetical protein
VTDPDPILRGLTSAIGRLTTGLGAVRSQLVAMEAAERQRHDERVRVTQAATDAQRAQSAALRAALRAMKPGAPDEPEPDPVGDAVSGLQVKAIGKVGGLLDAPAALVRAMAANKWATTATLVALGGLLLQIADGAPFVDALGRTLIALGSGIPTSTGSAP